MWMDEVFERFTQQSPFSVMTRATLEHLFADDLLNQVFDDHATTQYQRQLTFATVTTLLTQVVLRHRPSVRNAYRRAGDVGASLKAVYEKLQHVETAVSSALVEQVADRAQAVLGHWPASTRPDPVPGLRLRILDGNHLAGTQHRLGVLRGDGAAALPGLTVVLRDDRTGLLPQVACSPDGHASERALIPEALTWIEAFDLVVADRHFCCFPFLFGVKDRDAFFCVRHHEQVGLTEVGQRRYVGRSDSGEVYEQEVEVGPKERRVRLRCVIVELFTPTQEGETTIRLLSNVPAEKASALVLAEVYLRRWRIEHSFQELTDYLKCEVNTLGYPQAALLGFCLAVCAYNLLVVLKGALAAVHGQAQVEQKLSTYEMAEEIRQDGPGLDKALPASFWEERFGRLSSAGLAAWLLEVARQLPWRNYHKAKRSPPPTGPRPEPETKKGGRRRPHVSTARLLLGTEGKAPTIKRLSNSQ
jgi:hypothetical protein